VRAIAGRGGGHSLETSGMTDRCESFYTNQPIPSIPSRLSGSPVSPAMKIRFAPPDLEKAHHVSTLCRLVEEMTPPGMDGEIRLVQVWPDQPSRLVLMPDGRHQVSVNVPIDWLALEQSEAAIRGHLQELFDSAPGH
jgi:hypothetical protein